MLVRLPACTVCRIPLHLKLDGDVLVCRIQRPELLEGSPIPSKRASPHTKPFGLVGIRLLRAAVPVSLPRSAA